MSTTKSIRPIMMHRGAVLTAAIAIVSFLFFLLQPGGTALAVAAQIKYDTVAEFNAGTQFHTGLTEDPANGGDGNGEVRLLNIGINPTTWRHDGNDTGLPARWGHRAVQYKGNIYVSGGNTSPAASTGLNTVHYTTIQADHTLADWQTTTALPAKLFFHGMVALNDYMYVIGGLDNTATQNDTVYKAHIKQDGTLGSWTTTTPLPQTLSDFGTAVLNGTIYVVGGDHNGLSVNTVYAATPDQSGDISAWNSGATLPLEISRQAVANTASAIYSTGGAQFTSNQTNYLSNVYYGDGTAAWTSSSTLPENLIYAAAVAYGGQLYVVGGAYNHGGSLENSIRSDLMNPNGSLVVNGWQTSPVLSDPRQRSAAIVSDDGWIYAIQGQSGDITSGGTALKTIDYGPTVAAGGDAFAASGTYTSDVVDFGASLDISSIVFNTTLPSNTGMTFEYRASDSINFNDTTYQSAGSAPIGLKQDTTKSFTLHKRYFQFRANLTSTPSQDKTPVLNKVTIHYDNPITPTPTPTITVGASSTPTKTTTATVTMTPTGTRTPSPTPTVEATACATKPSIAQLVSPANGSKVKVRKVRLDWDTATCAQKYKVILMKENKQGKAYFKKKVTNTHVTTDKLPKGRTYFWRVKACNSIGCAKGSSWFKFKIPN